MPFTPPIATRALSPRFAEAVAFAEDLHAYDRRKDRDTPYIAHLLAVCGTVLDRGGDECEAIASLLLDAGGQGGPGMISRVRDRFGERVASITQALTVGRGDHASANAPWIERKRVYVRQLRSCDDPSVYFVSAVDRLLAVRSLMYDYLALGEALWLRHNSGKPGVVWYHEELVELYRGEPADARRCSIVDEIAQTVDRIKRYDPLQAATRSRITGRSESGAAAAL